MSRSRLNQLVALARVHDPGLAGWITEALTRWQSGEDLEHALDLAGPGARQLRDSAIARLGELVDPTGSRSTWALAGQISILLRRKVRTGDVGATVQAVLASGCHVPTSRRQPYEILKNTRSNCGSRHGLIGHQGMSLYTSRAL